MSTCKLCTAPHYARGFCRHHYDLAYERSTQGIARRKVWRKSAAGKLYAKRKRDNNPAWLWLQELKQHSKCVSCGENHPACLDFHHRNPGTKLFELGAKRVKMLSLAKVQAEAAKCNILCANCHRKLHASTP